MKVRGFNKMPDIKKYLNKANTLVIVLALAAILILVNIIADRLPLKFDMTVEKIFSLSDQTRKVLKDLKQEVNIVAFYQEGKEDATVKALLEEYVKASKGRIRVDYIDAEKNPIAAKRFDVKNEGVFNENIVFESGGNVKQVKSIDIYSLNNAYGKSFSGEQQFTGAILYVTSPKLTKIYFLEGHQETSLSEDLFKLRSKAESEACTVEGLNLVKTGSVPKDADVIAVASPKRDISGAEKEMLQKYLTEGGRAIFMFDVMGADTQLTNFGELLKNYGVGIRKNFVVEEDKNSYYSNNNMYLVPNYTSHNIVKSLKDEDLAIIFPYSMNLEILKTEDKNLIIEPLLQSSKRSWSRYELTDATPTKTDKDVAGPANIALVVERDNTDDRYKNTKLVVTGNAKFIENNMLDVQGNIDLFMNTVNWVQDKKEAISIRSKMMNSNQMMVRGAGYIVLMVISVAVIPMVAFGTGLFIWLRRRHA